MQTARNAQSRICERGILGIKIHEACKQCQRCPLKRGKMEDADVKRPVSPSSLLIDAGSVCNRPLNDIQPASASVTQLTTLPLRLPHSPGEHEEFVRTHYIFQDTGEPFSRRFTEWNPSAFERVNSPPEGDREHDSSGLMGTKGGH